MGLSCENATAIFSLGDSPLCVELSADSRGLTACRLLEIPCQSFGAVSNPYLRQGIGALTRYFAGEDLSLDCTLAPDGTAFQKAVWDVTRRIPAGEVRSYLWLAGEIGNPRAFRAVAQALGANPLLLFVPCHRVLRSNGDLGGFACGIHVKEKLLAAEGVTLPLSGVAVAAV